METPNLKKEMNQTATLFAGLLMVSLAVSTAHAAVHFQTLHSLDDGAHRT